MANTKPCVIKRKKEMIVFFMVSLLFLSSCAVKSSNCYSQEVKGDTSAVASIIPLIEEDKNTESSIESDPSDASSDANTNLNTGGSVLFFASDYQHRDGWDDPPVTLNKVLDAVFEAGVRPDNYIFCGDYSALDGKNNYNADAHDAIEEIKNICGEHDPQLDTEGMVFVQGNHDLLTTDISVSGLHDCGDYLVYVLNTETEYPWGQGKYHRRELVKAGAKRLEHCMTHLVKKNEMRPIFLASHVPLHFSGRSSYLQGTGDNVYASDLFQVINQAGEKLNLVYLFGHNHSRGWDSYLGGSCVFYEPGEVLLVPKAEGEESVTSEYTRETLNFTYLNAGYIGYFSSAGGEEALTCTVCKIWPDRLVFTRYDEKGVHSLNSEGTPNPAKDDRKLIGSDNYGTIVNSPQEVYFIELDSQQKKRAA